MINKALMNVIVAQEFVVTVQQRFALIDVKANQKESKKDSKKRKEPTLDLHNEIKIITASDEVFVLWSELISKYSQGELLDPETCEKMKLNNRWTPVKDGALNREFLNGSETVMKRTIGS